MRAIFAAIIAIALVYLADQELTGGRYTDAAKQVAGQLRHSLGF
jgi:hypothetical protein